MRRNDHPPPAPSLTMRQRLNSILGYLPETAQTALSPLLGGPEGVGLADFLPGISQALAMDEYNRAKAAGSTAGMIWAGAGAVPGGRAARVARAAEIARLEQARALAPESLGAFSRSEVVPYPTRRDVSFNQAYPLPEPHRYPPRSQGVPRRVGRPATDALEPMERARFESMWFDAGGDRATLQRVLAKAALADGTVSPSLALRAVDGRDQAIVKRAIGMP